MSIEWVNEASESELESFFSRCCSAENWVHCMVSGRPYNGRDELFKAADENWRRLGEADYLQAFEGHPMIGESRLLEMKDRDAGMISANEQSGVNAADQETLDALMVANTEYRDRFGFIFIVCATGKSVGEMLALLRARLVNTREEEIQNAAAEQLKITSIRLENLL